ncbi:peptidase dimerization domain protein [Methanocaldococcus infernus ME]|uniref:Peptidase dimerization domain protein n=1 Tax=Methanocaldococcus infernus (strain DSM 11812 / JCM 15783 / ME) TaxID=573063 RepID=D5VU00_METIM|nr:M20/M25/M40 family metallo-hydrolase [Methanocaldococcus infernus]ADG14053.1 peptidase dimerization domain protein [Methanocaldococcus infernus ME]
MKIENFLLELLKIRTDHEEGVKRAFKYLEGFFKELNIKCSIINNCFVAYKGRDWDVILNSHIDTVKFQTPIRIEGNKIYGTGAIDAKGQVALLTDLFLELDNSLLVISPDEEKASKGIYGFCQAMKGKIKEGVFCIVGEPTNLKVCIGHKGRFEYIIKAFGEPRHASKEGDNPIEKLSEIILKLKSLKLGKIKVDKIYSSKITPTIIRGGVESNIIPEEAEVILDVRSVENNIIGKIEKVINDYENVKGFLKEDKYFADFYLLKDEELINRLKNVSFFPATAEAYFFHKILKAKAVIFGVGDLNLAHTKHEFLDLKEFEKGRKEIRKIINLGE